MILAASNPVVFNRSVSPLTHRRPSPRDPTNLNPGLAFDSAVCCADLAVRGSHSSLSVPNTMADSAARAHATVVTRAAEKPSAARTHLGPDRRNYAKTDLVANAPKEQTWQMTLMLPST